jgi:S-adenosylmethionine:tRNA ribosyltransferase-isomerase
LTTTPITDLEYILNNGTIAQFRYKDPGDSRLLVSSTRQIITFNEYLKNLSEKSVFIFNKSSLQNVRIETTRTNTGGNIEFFILNLINSHTAHVLIKSASKFLPLDNINTAIANVQVLSKSNGTFTVNFNTDVNELINKYGKVPLPPYINDDSTKYEDYKNKFSEGGFSVATSTAGLHFSLNMISQLKNNGHKVLFINLDINLGTFKQINTDIIEDYKIHSEYYKITKSDYEYILKLKEVGYKVIAVGTTVLRTIETVANTGLHEGLTDLYITPGYKFKIPDYLITNFHAPKSSLLSIVKTIFGERWKDLYEFAQSNGLKFLSFGDAVIFNIDE